MCNLLIAGYQRGSASATLVDDEHFGSQGLAERDGELRHPERHPQDATAVAGDKLLALVRKVRPTAELDDASGPSFSYNYRLVALRANIYEYNSAVSKSSRLGSRDFVVIGILVLGSVVVQSFAAVYGGPKQSLLALGGSALAFLIWVVLRFR